MRPALPCASQPLATASRTDLPIPKVVGQSGDAYARLGAQQTTVEDPAPPEPAVLLRGLQGQAPGLKDVVFASRL